MEIIGCLVTSQNSPSWLAGYGKDLQVPHIESIPEPHKTICTGSHNYN